MNGCCPRWLWPIAWVLTACTTTPLRGEVWAPADLDTEQLVRCRAAGINTVVLALHDRLPTPADRTAADAVHAAGLRLGYWLEVGRCEALAVVHPEWLASMQGHTEWQRLFPTAPATGAERVVKAWPWLPVGYREAFAAHLQRVREQLVNLPEPAFVFLNDLQGPPSACGCGNVLCRWATDYTLHGRPPVRTATPLGADAAACFCAEVQRLLPRSEVVPVWVTECEEADTHADGACCGVGCYHGICWRAFDEQWRALRGVAPTTAILLPYREFGRDLSRYAQPGGWIEFALRHLRERAATHGAPIAGDSLIAVLQGYGDVIRPACQRQLAAAAGVRANLVLRTPLDTSWQPRALP